MGAVFGIRNLLQSFRVSLCLRAPASPGHSPVQSAALLDSVGSWQTTEKSGGAAIDTTADVAIGSKVVHVTGPVDLMTQIANSPEGQNCYAQRLVTFAYERELTNQDVCTVQQLAGKMTTSGYNIISLLTDLTQTQSFRYRVKELP